MCDLPQIHPHLRETIPMTEPSNSHAEIVWDAGGTPRSVQFDDPYFAREDGRAETRHVFLHANGLPERWQAAEQFVIAELGFGTGLNFLETCHHWHRERGKCRNLRFVSFEQYPMSAGDINRALDAWPELHELAAALLDQWPPRQGAPVHHVSLGDVQLELHLGDANVTLPHWSGRADAWYLDGFSPAKNPELWNSDLMQAVFDHTAPAGSFATYTAAGFVRRNLSSAGFKVCKTPGFGRKRESLAGNRI